MAMPKATIETITTSVSGLTYVLPGSKGYQRVNKKGSWIYLDNNKKIIRSTQILNRINALRIPPAWKEVWICPTKNGHIQATGLDKKGRKQYRYHEDWQRIRNETKFERMYEFGKKLSRLRKQVKKDINRKRLDKAKVTALALHIMQTTFIRAGNEAYEKENGSYGLTTLKNRHLTFGTQAVVFKFRGKKGVPFKVVLKDKALIQLLRKVKELPGQELFQYYDENKELHSLNSADINNYLGEHMGASFTSKDFRTWAGCFCALEYMQKETQAENAPDLPGLIDYVADRLGNTRAVCRKYYIHPQLLEQYESGTFNTICPKTNSPHELEKALLAFLSKRALS